MRCIRLTILIISIALSAISFNTLAGNLIHYAASPNGSMDYILFPQKDGYVFISDTIRVEAAKDDIMDALDSYLVTVDSNPSTELTVNMASKNRVSLYLEFKFGVKTRTLEFWGSPVFSKNFAASRIRCICNFFIKDNLCIYTLSNFETNRTLLPGEAKNDGDPNIIHWQRVNSLSAELSEVVGKSKNERKDKEKIYDYEHQIAYEHYLYANEANQISSFLNGLRETLKPDALGEASYSVSPVEAVYSPLPQKTIPTIDWQTYHGFLLDEGNNVFVDYGDAGYERAGAQELVKQIEIDGFWNNTYSPQNAHFIIKYTVNTEGKDKAYITVHDNKGNLLVARFAGSRAYSSESISENREVARKIYLNSLQKLQRSIRKGEIPSEFKLCYKRTE